MNCLSPTIQAALWIAFACNALGALAAIYAWLQARRAIRLAREYVASAGVPTLRSHVRAGAPAAPDRPLFQVLDERRTR